MESPKVGEILVKEGYLKPDMLDKVLRVHQKHKSEHPDLFKPFGQICVELNIISAEELQRVLRKYNKRMPLGQMLLNQELITAEALARALQTQQTVKKRLGEILVEQGALSSAQLLDVLSEQLDIARIIPSLELVDEELLQKLDVRFFKENMCLPLHQHGQLLTVVMKDPLRTDIIEKLAAHYQAQIVPALASPESILATLKEYQHLMSLPSLGPLSDNLNALQVKPPVEKMPKLPFATGLNALSEAFENQNAATSETEEKATGQSQRNLKQEEQIVSFLVKSALKDRAESIHIEPQEKHLRIRYRIDGVLYHKTDLPTDMGPALVLRLKELCQLDLQRVSHQRGRVETSINEQDLELNMATYDTLWGESMTIELKPRTSSHREMLLNIERTGFSPLNLMRYQNILNQPGGLIILTGPSRAGKTATAYASVNYLNAQNRSIVTAEHPIEMRVPGVVQGQYSEELHHRFADKVNAMLYLNPDILMVSEIEDVDVMHEVVNIALTGAKIITSYPAFDATGALLRLNRMGLENYLIAASNITVLSQRLIRKLCPLCKVPHEPRQDTFNRLGLVDVTPESATFYKPVGCDACGHHGYQGQTAIHELLKINEAIREAILNNKPAATVRAIARTECKLVSMAEDGLYKAMEGETSIEEVLRVAFVNEYDAQTPWSAEEIRDICKGLDPDFI